MRSRGLAKVNEILSLWRSPLDKVALAEAQALSDRRPRCSLPGYKSVFMYSNPMPLTLHVFGQSIVASTGIFFLPSAYDTFFFNSAPASFTWIGQ
jgi:hypothetical protein